MGRGSLTLLLIGAVTKDCRRVRVLTPEPMEGRPVPMEGRPVPIEGRSVPIEGRRLAPVAAFPPGLGGTAFSRPCGRGRRDWRPDLRLSAVAAGGLA